MQVLEGWAATALSHSIGRLIVRKPFYGFLLSQFRRVADPELKAGLSSGVGPDAAPTLYFNEKYMVAMKDNSPTLDLEGETRPWTPEELDGMLEHVCLHVVHDHAARREWRDATTWHKAADLTLNTHIDVLPPHALKPKTYRLADELSAEAYHEALDERQKGNGGQGGGQGGSQGNAPSPRGRGRPKGGKAKAQEQESHLDSAERWNEPNSPVAKSLMKDAVAKAQRLAGGRNAMQGYLPSNVQEAIDDLLKEPYDWRPILRQFGLGGIKIGRRPTRMRPNRRHGDLALGKKPRRTGRIAVLVDTSGSISTEDFAQFQAELIAMSGFVEVIVVECDATIHDVYKLDRHSPPTTFKGRGGTVFTPVFEVMAGKPLKLHPKEHLLVGCDRLVILTDGAATVPATNILGRPVLWALLPNGKRPVSYGEEIYIGDWGGKYPEASTCS